MHFGMCTFHGCQQNSPFSPASTFNLTQDADTDQWVRVAKSWGAKRICLTVHHTGGFALWPTSVTLPGGAPYTYSVAASPYQGGRGDIVRQFVESCRADGEVEPCFYIIPSWDNYVTTEAPNATADEYLQVQLDMLTELLSNYGPIPRLWFDKCVANSPNNPHRPCRPFLPRPHLNPSHPSLTLAPRVPVPRSYMLPASSCQPSPNTPPGFDLPALAGTWQRILGHVKQISPNTLMLPGPDGCLNPGEAGAGVYPTFNFQRGPAVYWQCANSAPAGNDTSGYFFAPHESVISVLNPGDYFFWDAADPVLSADEIFSHYTLAVGQGSNFNLNVPPARDGAVPADIAEQVAAFGAIISGTYSVPVATAASLPVHAPCPGLVVDLELPPGAKWDQIVLAEDLAAAPQLVTAYSLAAKDPSTGAWVPIASPPVHGGSIGFRVVDWGLAPVAVGGPSALRFTCLSSIDDAQPVALKTFAAYNGDRAEVPSPGVGRAFS